MRTVCESYPGITPLDCENMTEEQLLCLVVDMRSTAPTESISASEARSRGLIKPYSGPRPPKIQSAASENERDLLKRKRERRRQARRERNNGSR